MALVTLRRTTPLQSAISDFFDTDEFYYPVKRPLIDRTLTVPATNISESETEFKIAVAAPGFDRDDFSISIDNGVLEISAESEVDEESEDENFTRKEYDYNSFSRSFTLPDSVDTDGIEANYDNGILTMFLPKRSDTSGSTRQEIKVS